MFKFKLKTTMSIFVKSNAAVFVVWNFMVKSNIIKFYLNFFIVHSRESVYLKSQKKFLCFTLSDRRAIDPAYYGITLFSILLRYRPILFQKRSWLLLLRKSFFFKFKTKTNKFFLTVTYRKLFCYFQYTSIQFLSPFLSKPSIF